MKLSWTRMCQKQVSGKRTSNYITDTVGYMHFCLWYLGPVSIFEKTSFRKISWSLEAARFVFRIVRSLWNLTGTSAAVLPMCLSNFKAIRQFKVPISWLRDFTRSYEKTSFRILRRGPASGTPVLNSYCMQDLLFGYAYSRSFGYHVIRWWRMINSSEVLLDWYQIPH